MPEARLSADVAWSKRVQQATRLLAELDPAWISLHFVCYGFHARGFVSTLGHGLKRIVAGRRLHLMLHELWVMWNMKCKWRDRIMGIEQRRGVLKILRCLEPDLIDTTNPYYQTVMQKEGFECGIQVLCGSFPPEKSDSREWLAEKMLEAGLPDIWMNRGRFLVAGFFGTIFGHWDPEPLLKWLADAGVASGKEPILLSAGSCSGAGAQRFDCIPSHVGGVRLPKLRIGLLDQKQASEYLNTLDLGLTCYSPVFIWKSSVAATMLEHGLTVVAGAAIEDHLEEFAERSRSNKIVDIRHELPLSQMESTRRAERKALIYGEDFVARLKYE